MKRTLCLFLALILAVGICFSAPVTITASAATAESDFEYEENDGGITIYWYNGSDSEIVIPDTIDGKPVTIIDDIAFQNKTELTSVTIPESVTSIGVMAFSGCTELTEIIIPDSVKSIGVRAFYKCTSLETVKIGNGVETIGKETFSGCTALTRATIGTSVKTIGDSAFADCESLGEITIPDGVETIGDSAFYYCSSLETVTIPKSVTTIGSRAFYGIKSTATASVPCKWNEQSFGTAFNGVTVTIAPHEYENGVCEACGYECPGHTYELAICTNCSYVCHHETVTDGVCGVCGGTYCGKTESDTVVYFYNESTKTLTISGEGEMADFTDTTMPWYSYRSEITTIVINLGVTSIGEYSFSYCSALTSVTIPESVTSIGISAFYKCTSLPSVTIPSSVTTIESYAFNGCTSLTIIKIPDSVTEIGSRAFNGCTSLTTVTIPSSVTEIGSRAFSGCTSLTTVTLPSSVTTIDDYAFNGCTSLTIIKIPDSVTTIGANAFKNCTALTTIEIPDSVTKIGANAFNNCTKLTTVSVPCSWNENPLYTFEDGVKVNIERHTLENNTCTVCEGSKCGATESDTVTWVYDEGTLYINGKGAMADFTSTNMPWYSYRSEITTIVINKGVTTIGDYAFRGCTALTTIEIPDSVTTIGIYAFNGCTFLTTIEIPDSVTTIDDYAFRDCTALTTIKIPDSVTTIGGSAFRGCTALTTIEIPDSVTTIGIYAFYNCTALESIEIPDSVTTIGEAAFGYCTSLISVTIPENVTTIGASAFSDCTKLTTVNVPCNWDGSIYKFAESKLKFADHDTTKTATCISKAECSVCGEYGDFAPHTYENGKGKCTVANCDNACAHETITDGVCVACGGKHCGKTETDKVVWFCDAPDDAPGDENDETLSILTITGTGDLAGYTIGEAPWEAHRESIRGIDIKDGVTSIGNGTFCGCVSLTSVIIPGSVKIIGVNAFSGCEKLSNVRISDGVTSIGDGVFKECIALEEITIPESVETIGEDAFNSCTMLMTITIPQNVTVIGEGAFCNCTRLTEINVDEDNTTYSSEDGVLFNEGKTELICCPAGKVGDYEVPSGVTSISNYAFSSRGEFFAVTIPVSVTTIGDFAFAGSQYVNLIVEPGSYAHEFATTNSIPYTFNGYTEAETDQIEKLLFTLNADSESYSVTFCDAHISGALNIPATYNGKPVTTIGNYAFANCMSLSSVTIPESITTIGAGAFNSCIELISITIPENVTAIGSYAFDGCAILASINVVGANTKYSSVDGVLFNKDKTELICYPTGQNAKSYTILDSVITIGEDAFKDCTKLTSVTIPDSVTTIGKSAFYGCSELTSVKIGNGVTEIDDYAFDGCNNLSTVNVPCDWDTENPLYAFTENVSVVVADHKEIIYVDNNDGTHTAEYPCCGTVIGEPEKHSFDESEYCEFCEYQCPHPNYTNGRCDVCACYCPHTNTEPVYNSYEDNTNQHYKHYECCGVDEWAGYHEDENGDTKCDQCNVQLVAKAYLEPWTSQGVCNGDNYFVSLENAVDKVNEIYCKELILLSDAIIEEEKTITLESAILNTNGNKLTVNGTLVLSDSEYTGTTIPTGVVGSGTVKIGENFFKLADNGKWCCAEESQHTGSVQTCVGYLCELCGNYYGEANDSHDIVIDEAEAPTCTETGLTEGEHCTRCDYKIAQEVVPALNHKDTLVQVEAKAKTCTTVGWDAYEYCEDCNYTTYVEILASHELQEVKAKAPTCEATGYDAYKYCTECDYTTYVEKAKLGHDNVTDKAVAPTCTKTGLTEGSHCSRCDGATVKQEVIPATGHKEVTVTGKSATCTATGLTDGKKCSVCGTVTKAQETIKATGHKEVVIPAVAPTYTTVGKTEGKKCSVCGTITVAQKDVAKLTLATPVVTVKNSSTGVKVTWKAVDGAESYKVYRKTYNTKTKKYGSWKTCGTVTTTSYVDTKAKSGTKYKYTVKALNSDTKSAYKSSSSILFLSQPTVKIANNASGVKVSWNKITGATSYKIYRSEYKNGKWTGWKSVKTIDKGSTVSWTDKSAKSGVKYKYTVKAVNGKTASTYKSSSSLLYLTQPKVTVKAVSNGIKVAWVQSTGATSYKIYRSEYNAKTKKWSGWKGVKTAKSTSKSYVDKTAKKGVKYKYTVKAVNGKVASTYKASSSVKR